MCFPRKTIFSFMLHRIVACFKLVLCLKPENILNLIKKSVFVFMNDHDVWILIKLVFNKIWLCRVFFKNWVSYLSAYARKSLIVLCTHQSFNCNDFFNVSIYFQTSQTTLDIRYIYFSYFYTQLLLNSFLYFTLEFVKSWLLM